MGKDAILVRTYSGGFSLGASAATGINGSTVGYSAPPSGYTPIAFKRVDTASNNIVFRNMNVDGYGGNPVVVVRNLATTTTTGTLVVVIVFVRSDLIGT